MNSTTAAVHVTCEVRIVHPPAVPSEKFHERGKMLMDQLVCLEEADGDISDVSLAGDAGTRTWTIEMVVRTDDQFDALVQALTTIRTALHALGDNTAGWPTADEVKSAFKPTVVDTEPMLMPA